MHELLLFASVPPSRHTQLLKILAGISGMQPIRVIERHLLFKPKRRPESVSGVQVGGSQGIQNPQAAVQGQVGELFYMQLVGEVQESFFGTPGGHEEQSGDFNMENGSEELKYDLQKQSWSLRFNDLPEVAGRRPVTSRLISSVDVIDGNAVSFMDALGYK
jgi:mediator of RNA polymerase II transcription subunit 18, fungi type